MSKVVVFLFDDETEQEIISLTLDIHEDNLDKFINDFEDYFNGCGHSNCDPALYVVDAELN